MSMATAGPTFLVREPGDNAVHVLSGRDGVRLSTVTAPDGSHFGSAIAAAGDVDRDRVPDYLVGDDGFHQRRGRVQVISGRRVRVLFEIVGSRPDALLGAGVAGGADFDANGRPDFVIGAAGADRPQLDQGEVTTWSGWRASDRGHGHGPRP